MKNVKKFLSWREVEILVQRLAEKIPQKKYTSIYGIPRGGQIVAVLLSHQTGIKVIEYDKINRDTLVVDDIVDSGKTLESFMRVRKDGSSWDRRPHAAALYLCEESIIKPHHFAEKKRPEIEWVVFPWEKDATPKYDNTFNVPVVGFKVD